MTIERIINNFKLSHPEADTELLNLAYDYAEQAHQGQFRKSGEPYIQHCLHTAFVLTQIKADINTVAAGILHDVPEDTKYTLNDLEKNFGKDIKNLVEGITKLGKIKYRGIERYKENLKKMFLAMSNDIRVIFIKFCDRLHNLRTLESLPHNKQIRISQETMEIYAPIAELLGMWHLKWQMEDMCFKFLQPEEYKKLEQKYEIERRAERNEFLQTIKNIIGPKLEKNNIDYRIELRFKHLYSIYKKMKRKDRKFDEIYDVFALRVIVPNVDDCYKVLGIIHTLWRPKPNRFKDYISVPKPNGYQSLHTTVFGPEGKNVEFQIRTQKMHEESNYGIAAHWYYKGQQNKTNPTQPKWIQEILDIQKEITNTSEFVNKIKLDIFRNRIFVFSPKGDVFELPEGSTPIDFAYAVHTEIGNRAMQALINDKINTLDTELRNGDMVEIITTKAKKNANKDWLKFVKTKKAREKIKQYSKKSTFYNLKNFFFEKKNKNIK